MPPPHGGDYRKLRDLLMEQASKIGPAMRKAYYGTEQLPESAKRIPRPMGPPMPIRNGPRSLERPQSTQVRK